MVPLDELPEDAELVIVDEAALADFDPEEPEDLAVEDAEDALDVEDALEDFLVEDALEDFFVELQRLKVSTEGNQERL